MKLLVIDYRYPNNNFSLPGYEAVVTDLDNALLLMVIEQPDVIFAFVEYFAEEENLVLLEDVKRSMPCTTKFVRLGFMQEVKTDGEIYLQLPYSKEELDEVLCKKTKS